MPTKPSDFTVHFKVKTEETFANTVKV